MLSDLRQRKVARVLFDEFHGEAWTIRPDVARKMHPEHPEDASYADAAGHLAERDFEVATNTDGPLTDEVLSDTDVLVIAQPSEPKWERTVNENSPVFSDAEIRAVESFVSRGGGLVVLGEAEEDKYGSNLNEVLASFGIRIENATVLDYRGNGSGPTWIVGEPAPGAGSPTLLHLVRRVRFYRAGSLVADEPGAVVLRSGDEAQPAHAGLLAATSHGEGRVVVVADSDLFGDDHIARPRPPAALAQPGLLGGAAGLPLRPAADRLGGGARPRLGAPARRDQRPAPPAGAQGRGRPRAARRRARCAPAWRP